MWPLARKCALTSKWARPRLLRSPLRAPPPPGGAAAHTHVCHGPPAKKKNLTLVLHPVPPYRIHLGTLHPCLLCFTTLYIDITIHLSPSPRLSSNAYSKRVLCFNLLFVISCSSFPVRHLLFFIISYSLDVLLQFVVVFLMLFIVLCSNCFLLCFCSNIHSTCITFSHHATSFHAFIFILQVSNFLVSHWDYTS